MLELTTFTLLKYSVDKMSCRRNAFRQKCHSTKDIGFGIFYGFVNSNFTLHRTYPTGLNSHPTSIVKSILPLPAIIKILSKSCFNWKLNLLRHQHYFPLVINLIQNQSLLVILTTMIT